MTSSTSSLRKNSQWRRDSSGSLKHSSLFGERPKLMLPGWTWNFLPICSPLATCRNQRTVASGRIGALFGSSSSSSTLPKRTRSSARNWKAVVMRASLTKVPVALSQSLRK
ncbi:hypothetical protein D9M73_201900 [compost metagenome]